MRIMHFGVISLSLLLITLITLDTLQNVSFLADDNYLRVQLRCCLFFIADVLVEMSFAPKHWRYLGITFSFCLSRYHILTLSIILTYRSVSISSIYCASSP